MKIKFAGTVPYEHSPKSAPISWTLGKAVLSVPTYGKNYTTNRYSTYPAKFEKCSSS